MAETIRKKNYFLIIIFSFFFRLGGDEGSMMLSWSSLNPSTLVQQMSSFDKYFNFKSFEKVMKQVSRINSCITFEAA